MTLSNTYTEGAIIWGMLFGVFIYWIIKDVPYSLTVFLVALFAATLFLIPLKKRKGGKK